MEIIKNIPFSPPDISELEINEVVAALGSGWITTGPRTKLLEKRLAAFVDTNDVAVDVQNADRTSEYSNRLVCLNSATAAEELLLRVMGIGPGDEVIVPAYTYTASASAAIHCGADVKFVDIQKNGDAVTRMPEMDYDALEEAITERTKAIVAVDLGGVVCDYDRIIDIVNRKKHLFNPRENDGSRLGELSSRVQKSIGRVMIVADSAHSLGASRLFMGKKQNCGQIADFTSFSFHAVKNFTTAEGGAAIWRRINGVDDKEIYDMLQLLSLHGQNKDALSKSNSAGGSWEYDIIGPWYKCNMTDIMAAIGLRQLDRYPGLIARRREIIERYNEMCDELEISYMIHHTDYMDSSNHLYLIRVDDANVEQRNSMIEKFAQLGVATNVHYKPLPMMSAYRERGWDISKFPNSYDYYRNLITLPLYSRLTDEDAEYVCEALKTVVTNFRENR